MSRTRHLPKAYGRPPARKRACITGIPDKESCGRHHRAGNLRQGSGPLAGAGHDPQVSVPIEKAEDTDTINPVDGTSDPRDRGQVHRRDTRQ